MSQDAHLIQHKSCATGTNIGPPTLFNIGPENVVLDELHLMLRITDRLEHGIISDVVQWDELSHKSWSEQSD